ncbi:MAG: phage gp6-like head-tail connector protein [Phascolarctobacterium sp.]|nr:phage gp6-like head-tail connector protein [Candidatus Phascolarctobacterium caballi]
MVTVQQVKDYLRIPFNDDDTAIQAMLDAGNAYLVNAIDDCLIKYTQNEGFRKQADDWILRYWMPVAYNDREGQGAEGLGYVARSVLTQLQMYEVEVPNDSN